jgi:predicted  nucleic acid-binding Zn-ribbon protein
VLPVAQIASHEHACLKYRDYTEALHIETFQLYRDRANNYETEVRELNDRMSLQEQEIEDLEDTCDDFKMALAVVEAEKRVYAFEQQSVITAINKITRPLQSVTKKVQEINEAVEKVKAQMQEARDSHRAFSQKRRRISESDDEAVLVTEIVNFRDATDEDSYEAMQPGEPSGPAGPSGPADERERADEIVSV